MKIWIALAVIIAGIIYYFYYDNSTSSASNIISELQTEQSAGSTIIVYSAPDHPMTYRAIETLKIYGFKYNFVPVRSMAEVLNAIPQIKDKAESDQSVNLPLFLLANGELIQNEDFFNAVQQLPVMQFHEGMQKPYVIVYGVNNCVYTARARTELDSAGIPYEYIDMNSDPARYIGEAEARMRASGYTGNSYNTPIIEVNDFMRPRMEASEVIAKYKNAE